MVFNIRSLLGAAVSLSFAANAAAKDTCSGAGANPARYNFAIGPHKATMFSDGPFMAPIGDAPFLADPYLLKRVLREHYLPTQEVTIAKNVLYLDTGDDKILFDTGNGASGGQLWAELEAADIDRDDITKIMITHGHGDHISGLVMNASDPNSDLAFPNAQVYISSVEYDYWTADNVDPREAVSGQEGINEQAATFKLVFDKVESAGKLNTFGFNDTVIPGVTAMQTTYHTLGMANYVLQFSDSMSPFIVPGDSISHIQLQIENPFFESIFDQVPSAGPAGRTKFLAKAVQMRAHMGVYHAAFPGLGAVRPLTGATFRWYPAVYVGQTGVETDCDGGSGSGSGDDSDDGDGGDNEDSGDDSDNGGSEEEEDDD